MKCKSMSILVALASFFVGVLPATAQEEREVAVYTLTNASSGNAVLVFTRDDDGSLGFAARVATGGLGTGVGLGSQGALAISENDRWLFAVNPGSDDVSVFAVNRNGLQLTDRVPSGGRHPISLTVHEHLLYVLNAGGAFGASDNISGFVLKKGGKLSPLVGSIRPLSSNSTDPAQVRFTEDGETIVVTEKGTNLIDTFTVGEDGLTEGPTPHQSAGATPFGFAFGKRNHVFVSEAFSGAANASAVSSYRLLDDDSALETISASVPTHQTAACWVAVTRDGRFAYASNTGSGSISGYSIAFDGSLRLLTVDGRTAETGKGPIDMALSADSRILFVLNSGDHSISAFEVERNGKLNPVVGVNSLPSSANGLAAR